jgi:hypothetical protein
MVCTKYAINMQIIMLIAEYVNKYVKTVQNMPNMQSIMLKTCYKHAENAKNMLEICIIIYAEYAQRYAKHLKSMGKCNMKRICTQICKICKICEQK